MGNLEALGLDTLCGERCRDGQSHVGAPGDYHTHWPVHRRDGDIIRVGRDGLPHTRLVSGDGDHRPVRGQRTHQPPACGHQLQAIVQAEDPGQTCRHQFAHAVPDQHFWFHPPGLPHPG